VERGERMKSVGEKIFRFIFKFLFNNIDVLLFSVLIFIKLFKYSEAISPAYLYMAVVIPIIASIFVLAGISLIFKEKSRVNFLYIVDIVVSLILISDIMYYRYFKDIITVSAIRNAKLLVGVSDSVASLFNVKDLLYILDVFILFPFVKIYKRKKTKFSKGFKKSI
jgi:lipoteichoic acid synthase